MLINGFQTEAKTPDELVQQLAVLPSGFGRRNINLSRIAYDSDSESYRHNRTGMTAYNEWQSSKDPACLTKALEAFKLAARASLIEDNLPARANDLSNYGQICRLAGRDEQSIPAFEEAVRICEQSNLPDKLYLKLGDLHATLLKVVLAKQEAGLTEEAAQLRAKLRPLRKRSVNVMARDKGETTNPEAYRVEQGEVGFSSNQLIGTDNVNDCVCVIVRDPYTKKTALAHVDASVDVKSLQILLDRMPNRMAPEKPLEARLIGARFKEGGVGLEPYVASSKQNLEGIMRFFGDKHIDVLSASVLDPDQPTSIVVDPATFEIKEEVPTFPNPDRHLGNGKPLVTDWGKPLHLSFDLTSSKERAPILLGRDEVQTLRDRYVGKSEDEVTLHFKQKADYSDYQLPVVIEQALILAKEYEKSIGQVVQCLDAKIAALAERGVTVTGFDRDKAVKIISTGAIHLGHDAKKANQPLVDFIENKLFVAENGRAYSSDLEGLRNFRFPDQPYETIEAGLRKPLSPPARPGQHGRSRPETPTNTGMS